MAGIIIKALTVKGEKAIKESIAKERKETTFFQRQSFKQGFDRVIEENPLRVTITIKSSILSRYLSPEAMKKPVEESLNDEGATKDKDYSIEVI